MSLTALKGIGPKTRILLNNLSIDTVSDLLFHLPLRYEDRTRVVPIGTVIPGDHLVVEGVVILAQIIFANKRQLHVTLEDGSGRITLIFFHFNKAQQISFVQGVKLRCFGEVRLWQKKRAMIHPEYRHIDGHEPSMVEEALTPIYPTTEGLQQRTWRSLTTQALACKDVPELLPPDILTRYQLSELHDALAYIHRPPPDADKDKLLEGLHPLQQRLAFEELLAHQLSLRKLRAKIQELPTYALLPCDKLLSQFIATLPFKLTQAQQKAIDNIQEDLAQKKPMLRLIQGDVGSGKTVVAAIAALQAIENGLQVAIMAPTELLAEQHYHSFSSWFKPLGIETAWLAGKLKKSERDTVLPLIREGRIKCILGTHALFQESVEFSKLGLVIIDEQHRFGVAQRSALREKGIRDNFYPHQLIMTATPIPRTLAMTVYADLDTSIIDELPPGRTPINTIIINSTRRHEIIDRVTDVCEKGGQVYWVCPLIEESESLDYEAAENIFSQLQLMLPTLDIALVHGRLKASEKQAIMHSFQEGKVDLLVATTVIEVGINVPNATLMIIENSERMGLSQLHQLRGRVGRGQKESHCVLMYQAPLSPMAKNRLMVMRDSTDGFYIAEQDLKLRGPGEVFGIKQTGLQQLRIADIIRDRELLKLVQTAAKEIVKKYPNLIDPIIKRWIAQKEQLGQV